MESEKIFYFSHEITCRKLKRGNSLIYKYNGDFHSAFFLSRARLFYCLNWIVFHFIPHGSSEDIRKKSRATKQVEWKSALNSLFCWRWRMRWRITTWIFPWFLYNRLETRLLGNKAHMRFWLRYLVNVFQLLK